MLRRVVMLAEPSPCLDVPFETWRSMLGIMTFAKCPHCLADNNPVFVPCITPGFSTEIAVECVWCKKAITISAKFRAMEVRPIEAAFVSAKMHHIQAGETLCLNEVFDRGGDDLFIAVKCGFCGDTTVVKERTGHVGEYARTVDCIKCRNILRYAVNLFYD